MADEDLLDLTPETSPGDDDLFYLGHDPGGTPVDRSVALSVLRTVMLRVLSADPASPANGEVWIRAAGTSPTRLIEWRIRDAGTTYTLIAITV